MSAKALIRRLPATGGSGIRPGTVGRTKLPTTSLQASRSKSWRFISMRRKPDEVVQHSFDMNEHNARANSEHALFVCVLSLAALLACCAFALARIEDRLGIR